MRTSYNAPADMPSVIPVFPLPGALLLPRCQMPLIIFEPRYIAMVDDAMRSHRVIGMVQPETGSTKGKPPLYRLGCAGKITSFAETDDNRYLVTLTGLARYRIEDELTVITLYRQCRVDFLPFADDFSAEPGRTEVDRDGLLRTLRSFAEAHSLPIDWEGVDNAPNDMLVNALSMMCPFGPKEKQALLEAPDLKVRADVLIAMTEIELARGGADDAPLWQ